MKNLIYQQLLTCAAGLLLLLFLTGCTATGHHTSEPLPPKPEVPIPQSAVVTDLLIIGEIEPVTILSAQTTFQARIDTGATTSSLDARDIVKFERDGKPWVRFAMVNRKTGEITKFEAKITKKVKIKRHGAESQERLVVKMKIKLGSKQLNSEFSLTDRSGFSSPVLIGRNVLEGNFLVDVSKRNTTSLMKEE